ncbi:nitrogen fixation protein NifQ [Rhodopseudomonas rhenobacensis]|uniref:Nitrogen fixation protein NifQ n=1 Tax=Rhodopseudomonas rhenobacensis TaxID=87461 RepID=A0A7W7Z4V1_9BRAD|nr:nitrogen fixation protein NifQ [Rhodopseudomonas rhenobacensis]
MIGAALQHNSVGPARRAPHLVVTDDCDEASPAAAIYRVLTGRAAASARIDDDREFDRHVLASILAVALTEQGALAERSGLLADDLVELLGRWFPHIAKLFIPSIAGEPLDDDEAGMVRDLLLANRSSEGDVGRWLAAMVARRAMEPNHLWEDLGLRDRNELSRLLTRHFAPLALSNTGNMRWKRFFYRKLCEDDGIVMCSTPVCTHCGDFARCFGDESGESRMADRRRTAALQAS